MHMSVHAINLTSSTGYCKLWQTRCLISRTCINKTQLCDGSFDCGPGDATDESDCNGECFYGKRPVSA